MIVKISMKETRLKCDNWRGIWLVIAKVIMELINEYLEA